MVGNFGLSLSGLHRVLCLCGLVCQTNGRHSLAPRYHVHGSRRDSCLNYHLIERMRTRGFQDYSGSMASHLPALLEVK